MVIKKNEKVYTVTENKSTWTVKADSGKLSVAFSVSKELCKTSEALKEYVLSEEAF